MQRTSHPTLRPAGRIILVDAQDRVLRMLAEDHSLDEPLLWITPGGACEDAETPEQAAVRELHEETGIQSPYAGPCVWRRRHVWRWGERMIESIEYFHFLRINDPPQIAPAAPTVQELGVIREYRWWTIAEMREAREEVFVPPPASRNCSLNCLQESSAVNPSTSASDPSALAMMIAGF